MTLPTILKMIETVEPGDNMKDWTQKDFDYLKSLLAPNYACVEHNGWTQARCEVELSK